MTCGSGCCGPPAVASFERQPPSQTPVEEDEDSCCGGVTSTGDKDPDLPGLAGPVRDELAERDSWPRLTVSTPCQDACCGGPTEEAQDSAGHEVKDAVLDNDCCASVSTEPGCNNGCCSTPELPRCCEGKTTPCCDQSCLDRLALRECENHELALSASHGKLTKRRQAPGALLMSSIRRPDRSLRNLRLRPRRGRQTMRQPR